MDDKAEVTVSDGRASIMARMKDQLRVLEAENSSLREEAVRLEAQIDILLRLVREAMRAAPEG